MDARGDATFWSASGFGKLGCDQPSDNSTIAMNPKRPRRAMTAAEDQARLRATGQYEEVMARKRALEEERAKRDAEVQRAEEPLIADLRSAGLVVSSVCDLVSTSSSYDNALPILLEHLKREYPLAIRDGIARYLAVSSAKFAWAELVSLCRAESHSRVKDALAAALAGIVDEDLLEQLIGLLRDSQLGKSRIILLLGLERVKGPRARAAFR